MKEISPITHLATKGFVHVPYPTIIRPAVLKAVGAWKEFCSLSEEIKTKFSYNPAGGMGVGYELKKTPGSFLDLKEDYHYTIGMKKWLAEAAIKVDGDQASELVASLGELAGLMSPLVVQFASEMEKAFSLEGFAREVADSQDVCFFRAIHYFPGSKVGNEIAKSHADKSGFTLHLYESDPGLQFLDLDKKWNDVPLSDDETVIIPGMRGQYRSKNQLKALFHRVVSTPVTEGKGRFSMVLFVHLKNTPEYNKQGSGRLQEFEPGFNYSMSFEEFSELFVAPR